MSPVVTAEDFDAVLFDLDGVLTTTRAVHAAAWEQTFNGFLDAWDGLRGSSTPRFDEQPDYAVYVDGKPREAGVRDFLVSRGITLPEGSPDSPPTEDSISGLANRKEQLVDAELGRIGVQAIPGSVAWIRELREGGIKTAVVSSSRNCAAVLESAGITNLFDTRVDGMTSLELGLDGKPAPDGFLEAARRLGVSPQRSVVVEDAIAGVEAGRAGSFGLVIGVDRTGRAEQLAAHGAHLVVSDLSELLVDPSDHIHRSGPRRNRLQAAAERIFATGSEYTIDAWRLVERSYNPDTVEQTETLFALSNGYLGLRGSFDEGEPSYRPATLLNGFHETWPIVYPESAYGFATTGQTIVPAPDGTTIRLFIDEDPITCQTSEVHEFERTLDLRRGVLERSVVYQLPDGRRFRVDSTRFVSLAQRHLAGIRYEITALDEPGSLVVCSELTTSQVRDGDTGTDPRQSRTLTPGTLQADVERTAGNRVIRTYRTTNSDLAVAAGMEHEFDPTMVTHAHTRMDPGKARVVFHIAAVPDRTVTITKWLAYHYGKTEPTELADRVELTLDHGLSQSFTAALADHQRHVISFWDRSELVWEGGIQAQQALHFSLFSLMQASLRAEGHGVPAKGLTGTGYEGHYFWDTEAYLLPFLTHTSPEVARSLLMHRIRMLPDARRRAREVGCSGALFPWRTINGEEASANYEAGTAQYHIDADIAYALDQYAHVAGDTELMYRHGVELLVETARMWTDLGFFSDRHGGSFVIHKVTGPDEYSTVVDNNLYTNVMAAHNLRAAADWVDRLRAGSAQDYRDVVERTRLCPNEPVTWRRAAERMYIPYDQQAGVHLQDDHFLDQAPWDFAGTPPDKYPLLLHYHPLVIYRHQVIKQTDVVFATVLLPERFTAEERRRIFEYYDPLTTGDSSLSECIQAIAAADVGKYRSAEEYLVDAVALDIADTAGNLRDGIHVASAGGTWMAVVYGFARYRWRTGDFAPMLPTRARRLHIPLQIQGSQLDLDITESEVTYALRSGQPLTLRHYGTPFTAATGAPVSFAGQFRTRDADLA